MRVTSNAPKKDDARLLEFATHHRNFWSWKELRAIRSFLCSAWAERVNITRGNKLNGKKNGRRRTAQLWLDSRPA
jgi:hypothetical protein